MSVLNETSKSLGDLLTVMIMNSKHSSVHTFAFSAEPLYVPFAMEFPVLRGILHSHC